MKILSDYEIKKRLSYFLDENGITNWDTEQTSKLVTLFKRVMNDEININMSAADQESMITSLAYGMSKGEKEPLLYREHTSYKHINYFDVFMQKGESDNVLDVLAKYKIPPSVLRGVRIHLPLDGDKVFFTNKNGKKDFVELIQKLSKGENGSPVIEYFEIKYHDKPIYKFENVFGSKKLLDSIREKMAEFAIGKDIEKREVQTPDYTYYQHFYKDKNDNIKVRKQYAAGTIINGKNKGGKFFK